MFSPLPFLRQNAISENLRVHAWANAGSLVNLDPQSAGMIRVYFTLQCFLDENVSLMFLKKYSENESVRALSALMFQISSNWEKI